jgi:7,8-dihydropterin-6-yl-methyl-4-(beta-D-ribofuranosyl)aminobenzene 5'-phosphate synthase
MCRTSNIILLALLFIALGAFPNISLPGQKKGLVMIGNTEAVTKADIEKLTIKVVYDNNPYIDELETAWGFSALITGTEKTILFDTGGDGALLLRNMDKLAIEPNSIDVVALSHIHGDHTGGLAKFLEANNNVTVYLPESFPKKFKEDVIEQRAKVIEVKKSIKICQGVYSTGQIGTWIKEQALVIQTDNGVIVITGCAHPGIVKIVKTAKDLFNDNILFVMGGFHLEWMPKIKINRVISSFNKLQVRYVGPCHCTGNRARRLFEEHFGENYINVGAGKVIKISELK